MSKRRRSLLLVAALGTGLFVGVGCGGSSGSGTAGTTYTFTKTAASTLGEPSVVRTGDDTVKVEPPAQTTPLVSTQTVTDIPDRTTASGDERTRVPVLFDVESDGTLIPDEVVVPPGLPAQLVVTSGDGKPHVLRFATRPPVTVKAPAHGQGSADLPGQRKGTYSVSVDGGALRPAFHVADDVGP